MFLEPVQEGKVKRSYFSFIHEYDRIEVVVYPALRIRVRTNGDSTIFFVSTRYIRFIEKVIQRALDRIVDILKDNDISFGHISNNLSSHIQVVGFAFFVTLEGTSVDNTNIFFYFGGNIILNNWQKGFPFHDQEETSGCIIK